MASRKEISSQLLATEIELKAAFAMTFPKVTPEQFLEGMSFLAMHLARVKGSGENSVLDWMGPMAVETLRENIYNIGRLKEKNWSEKMIYDAFDQVLPEVVTGRVRIDPDSFKKHAPIIVDQVGIPYGRDLITGFAQNLRNIGFIKTLEDRTDKPLSRLLGLDIYDTFFGKAELETPAPLFISTRHILHPHSASGFGRAA